MMYPILCKVRYETLHRTFRAKALWIQIAFSIVVNWIIAPLFMVCFVLGVPIDEPLLIACSWHWRGHSCQTNGD